MKVNGNKPSGVGNHLDIKGGRAESTSGLNRDLRSGSLSAKNIKDSSNVDVSERAQMMKRAKAIASKTDSVDEAKVARLQKLIDEGKYKVDSEAIADRLVDEHLATSE